MSKYGKRFKGQNRKISTAKTAQGSGRDQDAPGQDQPGPDQDQPGPGKDQGMSAPPACETLRKPRTDVVQKLYVKGGLTEDQLRASEEIRAVWEAWARGLFPKARRIERDTHAPARQPYRTPIDRMRNREYELWRHRYVPWSEQMQKMKVAGRKLSRHRLVMDIVIENYAPRQLETHYRLRHGAALTCLREALTKYCEGVIEKNRKKPIDVGDGI